MMETTSQGIVDWVEETDDRRVSGNASTRIENNTGREIDAAVRHRIEATPFTLLKTIDDVVGCLVGISCSASITTGPKQCSRLHNHMPNAKHWPS